MKRFAFVLVAAAIASLGFGLSAALQAAPPPTLVGSVGPGYTISLKKSTGAQVLSLQPGTYKIVVKDLGTRHDFHLVGPGVNKKTGIASKSTVTWTVGLKSGQYRLFCDVHASMRRTFRVVPHLATTAQATDAPQVPPTTAPATTYAPGSDY